MEASRWQDTGQASPGDTHTDMHTGRAVLTVGCGLYLAPGLHPPVLAGLRVTALAQRGRKAGQGLAVERPQAPVVSALLTLNLPDLEAAAAVPGTLCGEREERGPESPEVPQSPGTCSHEEAWLSVKGSVLPHTLQRRGPSSCSQRPSS